MQNLSKCISYSVLNYIWVINCSLCTKCSLANVERSKCFFTIVFKVILVINSLSCINLKIWDWSSKSATALHCQVNNNSIAWYRHCPGTTHSLQLNISLHISKTYAFIFLICYLLDIKYVNLIHIFSALHMMSSSTCNCFTFERPCPMIASV